MTVRAELDCDEVIRTFPGGGEILVLSIPKETWLKDLPDRRYFVRGVALWCEVKSLTDKLTTGQYDFLAREHRFGSIVFAGDADALRTMIYQRLPSTWREVGWWEVEKVKARGFRKERAA